MKGDKNTLTVGWFSALSLVLALTPVVAYSQASFFQGKTITIVQGRDPGGTGDLRVRALVPFLQKYIPGNPTIIIENVPGAAGRKAGRRGRPEAHSDFNVPFGRSWVTAWRCTVTSVPGAISSVT